VKVPFADINPDYRIEDAWKEFINPVLRDAGYKGSGRNFRRIAGEFVQCVNLQGARYGGSFAINIGIQPLAMFGGLDERVTTSSIKEIDCEFRRRATDGPSDQWWDYTQLVSSKKQAAQNAASVLRDFGVPVLERMCSPKSPLLTINPVSFSAGIFDFLGFGSTKIRMALTLAQMRKAAGDLSACRSFAQHGLDQITGIGGIGLRPELTELASIKA
jgi:Domain of unknown function (DUF4304)